MRIKHLIAMFLAAGLLFVAVGCQQTPTPSAPKDRTLTLALDGDPPSLDSYGTSNAQGHIILSMIQERLIVKDDKGEYTPWLAADWELVDDTTMRFNLRDDVFFSDGTKFTPEDAVFSLKIAAESSFTRNLFGAIDVGNTKVTGDNSIEVKLLRPDASLFEALSSPRAVMLSQNQYEPLDATAKGRTPLGTGPFQLSEWISGDRLELIPNEHYWGDLPEFNKVVARVVVEASTRSIDLETGGVDIAFNIAPTDWNRIESNPKTKLLKGMTPGVWFITFNNEMKPFDDIRVRKAIAYAINLEAMVDIAWQGVGYPATSHIPSTVFAHKALGPWEYNPEKAKQLLADAGYPNGLDLKFMTFEQALYLSIAETAQEMLREVGINITIEVTDLATFTSRNNNGEISFSVMNTQAVIPDPTAALLVWPTHRTISIRHNDKHVDALMEAGASTYDRAERIAIYAELQEYLWDKLYTLPVGYASRADGVSSHISGFEFVPNIIGLDLMKVHFND